MGLLASSCASASGLSGVAGIGYGFGGEKLGTINYDKLIKYSKIIIDTRGRLKNKKSKKVYII